MMGYQRPVLLVRPGPLGTTSEYCRQQLPFMSFHGIKVAAVEQRKEIGEGLRQCLRLLRRVGRTAAVGMVSLADPEFRDRGDERRHGLGRVMIEVLGSCPRSAMGALPGTPETEMALARRKCNSVRLRT